MSNINSGCIGINITRDRETARAVSLQLIGRKDTALPSPLYHSGATGIDIIGTVNCQLSTVNCQLSTDLKIVRYPELFL
jgi:hypothetical protein